MCRATKRKKAVLNDLPSETYTTEARDKIIDDFKYAIVLVQSG